jgi:hypothetical protein
MTLIFLIGCTTAPKIVSEPEIIEVPVDRYVAIDPALTKPVPIAELPPREEFEAMSGKEKLIHLGVLYQFQRVRAQQCNGQLLEISKLGPSE